MMKNLYIVRYDLMEYRKMLRFSSQKTDYEKVLGLLVVLNRGDPSMHPQNRAFIISILAKSLLNDLCSKIASAAHRDECLAALPAAFRLFEESYKNSNNTLSGESMAALCGIEEYIKTIRSVPGDEYDTHGLFTLLESYVDCHGNRTITPYNEYKTFLCGLNQFIEDNPNASKDGYLAALIAALSLPVYISSNF